MTLLDKIETIGRAKPGTRLLVCETFTTRWRGEDVMIPIGTVLEARLGTGGSLSVFAEVDGQLRGLALFMEHFHCIEAPPER